MNKNLIKIEGIYNNLKDTEEYNVFCTMLIDFSDFDKIRINIKNCEVEEPSEYNKNLYISMCSDLADYFGAFISKIENLDGRTKEAKNLPYFSIEEYLANFQ